MEPLVRLGQRRKLAGCLPVEDPAVDQEPPDDDTMPAQKLGRRMRDDVGAQFKRLA